MNSKKQRGLTCAGLALAAAAFACPANAQAPAPVTPSDLDRTQFRGSARAMGMGGTDLIMFGDVGGAAFNPASVGGAYSESQSAVGRTSNVHVAKINDLSNGLKHLGDQFNNSNGSLASVRDSFQKVYNFATDAGANDKTGSPATLSASVAPLVGFSVRNVGIVGYGTLVARVDLQPVAVPIAGLTGPAGKIFARYGALGLTNVSVPFSVPVGVGTFGIAPRFTQASFASAGFLVDETDTSNGTDPLTGAPNGNIVGATYKEVHQQKFDVDLGFTSIPDPVYHVRGALVVRNLLSPTFHLPRVVNGSSLGVVPAGDFEFQMKPQIDLGGLTTMNKVTYAAELHNLNNVNGGKRSFHLGLEYPLARALSLRAGYDRSRFVAGLGLSLGGARLDLAAGTDPQQQVALGLTFGGR